MNTPVPDGGAGFRAICQSWLEEGLRTVGGDFLEQLESGPPLPRLGTWRHEGEVSDGPPGSTWALLSVTRLSARGSRRSMVRVWSPQGVEWLYRSLEKVPLEAQIDVSVLNRYGTPGDRGVRVTVERPFEVPDWLVLTIRRYLGLGAGPGIVRRFGDRMYEMLESQASRTDATFGYIADDAESIMGLTPLEDSLWLDL
ncbi:hypothetical protein [Thermomonospora echinospora]|nr:hypothetical protein [Thermomonospora echinospora]